MEPEVYQDIYDYAHAIAEEARMLDEDNVDNCAERIFMWAESIKNFVFDDAKKNNVKW